ncbi:MAG: type II toxin-antitoxin system RelE/ParE family toxin [Gemmatimonadota bacterium]|nr:type II toxin-antitoxin system RelE/ParE family toxin [Gemmatimonadota bacterium]MDE2870232.1 type II toxin-antitoxin system RelE/ParE family toxin [Gemmatimonadota bacterium]
MRKLRWRSKGRGKRGGSRVIYYWLAHEDHIYLLTIYAKADRQDLTAEEIAAWRAAVREIENG